MPGGDRTGPAGMGPMTGRAAGYCAGYPAAGYANPIPGRGFGFGGGRGFWGRGGGWGGGRGWRNRYYATGLTGWQRAAGAVPWGVPAAPTQEQELDALKGQAEYFEDAFEGIKKRIEELEAGKTSK